MNNYLSSIAARILDAAPAVRPRLGGHFEPPSVLIDTAKSFPRNATQPSQPDAKREEIGFTEAAEKRVSKDQPEKSFAPAPQLDHPATPAPAVNASAPTTSRATNSIVDAAPSLTAPAPFQQTIAESPPQNRTVEARAVEKGIDLRENSESRSRTPGESHPEAQAAF